MPLKLKLKPNEKLLVNGAVIQNGERRTEITVHTYGDTMPTVLRGSDIMQENDAVTPSKAIYYLIQMMVVDQVNRAFYVKQFDERMVALAGAIHQEVIRDHMRQAILQVRSGDFYKAMAAMRPVLKYEEALLPGHEERGPALTS